MPECVLAEHAIASEPEQCEICGTAEVEQDLPCPGTSIRQYNAVAGSFGVSAFLLQLGQDGLKSMLEPRALPIQGSTHSVL
jgi:hypothetical protein